MQKPLLAHHCESGDGKNPEQRCLKGLGHALLGNFSADQIVLELTKIWK